MRATGTATTTQADGATAIRVCAYPAVARAAAAVLVALSGGSLGWIAGRVVTATDPPVTPPVLVLLVGVVTLPPALAAAALRAAFAGVADLGAGTLVVIRRGARLEVPLDGLAAIVPWVVPLPGPGLALRMRSGRRIGWTLRTEDPTPLLGALASGGLDAARPALVHPTVVYARAKYAGPAWRWYHLAAKFGAFSLVPAGVLFNAHQHIAFGGPLGQYHTYGLGAYLRTFAEYWLTTAIYCVLWASPWRGLAEAVALGVAWLVPRAAGGARRAGEAAGRIAYYGGIPLLLLLRFAG
jgi:hypothetical protein